MKESMLKTFVRETYKNASPIPYIISIQVALFVLIYLFDLLGDQEIVNFDLFTFTYEKLSLPSTFTVFLQQPWSILTHAFIYKEIFRILFDCLWLFWFGNIFLNLLNTRQLLTLYFGGIAVGALTFLLASALPFFGSASPLWNGSSMGLAALIIATTLLVPTMEVRLLLFGNVKLKTIAALFLGLEFGFLILYSPNAAPAYLAAVLFGFGFLRSLRKGNDWSSVFQKSQKNKNLKVVHSNYNRPPYNAKKHPNDLPNQEVVDQVLDKISVSGYESLTSQEKEILFRASKQGE
ncbi:rhomboid family intramembrane serine protease [Sphingobacterium sp. Mn56C]|uniref:rhomboid family intramembrane serine protease n=1 Tax=Sphingobacterium sp. Mn56C TaxID=3395261 RepID=UPI003BD65571